VDETKALVKGKSRAWDVTQWLMPIGQGANSTWLMEKHEASQAQYPEANGWLDHELYYIHLADVYGNTVKSEFIQVNNFDSSAPTIVYDGGNHVTVTENGGAGIAEIRMFQDKEFAGPGVLYDKPEDYPTVTRMAGYTNTQVKYEYTPVTSEHGFVSMAVRDRAGLWETKTFRLDEIGGDGSAVVTIEIVDAFNTAAYRAPFGTPLPGESPSIVAQSLEEDLGELMVLAPHRTGYGVLSGADVGNLFRLPDGILSLNAPQASGGKLRIELSASNSVQAIAVTDTGAGHTTILDKNSANVTLMTGPNGETIWAADLDAFPAGDLAFAALVDGSWVEFAGGIGQASLVDLPEAADCPREDQDQAAQDQDQAGEDQDQLTTAPPDERKNWLAVILQWIRALINGLLG
jgi:hypothetical protein